MEDALEIVIITKYLDSKIGAHIKIILENFVKKQAVDMKLFSDLVIRFRRKNIDKYWDINIVEEDTGKVNLYKLLEDIKVDTYRFNIYIDSEKKENETFDFAQLVYYKLLIKSLSKWGGSFAINLTVNISKYGQSEQNALYFSLGQILNGTENCYCIQNINGSDKRVKLYFPEESVLTKFTPIINFNKNTYNDIFVKRVKHFIEDSASMNCSVVEYREKNIYNEEFDLSLIVDSAKAYLKSGQLNAPLIGRLKLDEMVQIEDNDQMLDHLNAILKEAKDLEISEREAKQLLKLSEDLNLDQENKNFMKRNLLKTDGKGNPERIIYSGKTNHKVAVKLVSIILSGITGGGLNILPTPIAINDYANQLMRTSLRLIMGKPTIERHEDKNSYKSRQISRKYDRESFSYQENSNSGFDEMIYEQIKNESIVAIYIFSLIWFELGLRNELEREVKVQRIGNDRDLATLYKNEFSKHKKYLVLARKYATGLREIVENAVFHSSTKHDENGNGFLFLEFVKGYVDSEIKIKNNLLQSISSSQYIDHLDSWSSYFLRVLVFDNGNKGIVKSYTEMPNSNKNVELGDFFSDNHIKLFEKDSRITYRAIAHLGLKSFSNTVKESTGYFLLKTNGKRNNESICIYGNSADHEDHKGSFLMDGTHYNIILPIEKGIASSKNLNLINIDRSSFYNVFNQWITKKMVTNIEEISFSSASLSNFESSADKENKIAELVDSIKLTIFKSLDSSITKNYHIENGISINFDDIVSGYIDEPTTFLKVFNFLCANIQLEIGFNYIVFYNVREDFILELIEDLKSLKKSKTFWNKDTSMYMYDENEIPFIIGGETWEQFTQINKEMEIHYGCQKYIEKLTCGNTNINNEGGSTGKAVPLDLLVYSIDADKNKYSLFDKNIISILNKDYVSDQTPSLGAKLENVHMKIGSKLHLTDFYYADVLFENSFYVDRFAYVLAKDIYNEYCKLNNSEKNIIVLLGYGEYSEMLLYSIKKILSNISAKNEIIFNKYFICKDVEELEWLNTENINDFIDCYKEENTNVFYAVIIPIATTLTTNYKVFYSWFEVIKSKLNLESYSNFENQLIYNSSYIVVRDVGIATEKLSKTELKYEWEDINTENKEIKIKSMGKSIKYHICLRSQWNESINCKFCMPPANASDSYKDEHLLLETSKASISPQIILGLPQVEQEEGIKCFINIKKLNNLETCLKSGHTMIDNYHGMYYFETMQFFRSYKEQIRSWLKTIKNSCVNLNVYNIIITSLRAERIEFINCVNETVFDNTAQIIRLDIEKDFKENIHTKYRFLSLIFSTNVDINLFFVEDMIVSGQTITDMYNHIKELVRTQTNYGNNVKFKSAIVLISSLTNSNMKHLRKDSGNNEPFKVEAFTSIVSNSIISTENLCYMCNIITDRKQLLKKTVTNKIVLAYKTKLSKLELRGIAEMSSSKRATDRFFLSNELYIELGANKQPMSDAEQKEYIKSKIKENMTKYESTEKIYNRINIVKVLSMPYFSYYRGIRSVMFTNMLIIINNLINGNLGKDISVVHFNLLIVLMKQLTEFKSNYIIRKGNMRRIWSFYIDVCKKFGDKIKLAEVTINAIKSSEILDVEKQEGIKTCFHENFGKVDAKIFTNEISIFEKTVANIESFDTLYASLVKKLAYDDEAKSIWIESLFKNGDEYTGKMNTDFYEIDNNLYGFLTKDCDDEYLCDCIKAFIEIVFLENLKIQQKTLIEFSLQLTDKRCNCLEKEKKSESCPIEKLFKEIILSRETQIDIDVLEIFRALSDKICKEYYFDNYRNLIGLEKEDHVAYQENEYNKDLLRVFYIKLLIYGFNCEKISEDDKAIEFLINNIMRVVLMISKQLMRADDAFLSIKDHIYGNTAYIIECDKNNKTISKTENIEIDGNYENYEIWNSKKENSHFSNGEIKSEVVVNLFVNNEISKMVGSIHFGYINIITEEERNRYFGYVRNLLLIQDELVMQIVKITETNYFRDWIKKRALIEYISKMYIKFRHGAENDIEKLIDNLERFDISTRAGLREYFMETEIFPEGGESSILDVQLYYLVKYYAYCMESDSLIGFLFQKYISEYLKYDKGFSAETILSEEISGDRQYNMQDVIFTKEFRNVICRAIGGDEKLKYIIRKDIKTMTNIKIEYLRSFIVEIIKNAKKNNRAGIKCISIEFDENSISIWSIASPVEIKKREEIQVKLKKDLLEFKDGDGIGLNVIDKALRSIGGGLKVIEVADIKRFGVQLIVNNIEF